MGRDDATAQREAMQKAQYYRWVSDDPQVRALSKDGVQEFRARTAARIVRDHGEKVLLNYCPRCRGLARTTKAPQLRFCGFDWHSAILDHA